MLPKQMHSLQHWMQTAVLQVMHTTACPAQTYRLFRGNKAVSQEACRIPRQLRRFRPDSDTPGLRTVIGLEPPAHRNNSWSHLRPAAQTAAGLCSRGSQISLALIIHSQSPTGSRLSLSSLC